MAGCGIAVLAIASNGNDGAGFLYAAGIFILGVVFGMVVYHFPYLEMQRDLNYAQWERDMWRARYYNLEKRLKHDPSRSVAWPTDGRIEVLERT